MAVATKPQNAGYSVVSGIAKRTSDSAVLTPPIEVWFEYKELTLTADDIANNRSRVHVILYGHNQSPSSSYASWTGSSTNASEIYYYDGSFSSKTQCNIGAYTFRDNTINNLGETTLVVPHNSDGSKTISIYVDLHLPNTGSPGKANLSVDNVVLTQIPRESTITSLTLVDGSAFTDINYATTFKVNINRPMSGAKEKLFILYGENYASELYSYNASTDNPRQINIPVSSAENKVTSWSTSFKVAIETYDANNNLIGSRQTFATAKNVNFSDSQRAVLTSWQNAYWDTQSSITVSRGVQFFYNKIYYVWNGETEKHYMTNGFYKPSGSQSSYVFSQNTGTGSSIIYSSINGVVQMPTNSTSRLCTIGVESYNEVNGQKYLVGIQEAQNQGITIRSGDTSFNPTVNNLVETSPNNTSIPDLLSNYVVGTTKVNAELPAGAIETVLGATVSSSNAKIKFPDGDTKTGTNTQYTSNAIDRTPYNVVFEVTDSRGLVGTRTVTINATTVNAPTFSTLDVYRANSSGVRDDTGTYIYAIAVPDYVHSIGNVTNVCTMSASVNGGSPVTLTSGTLTRIFENADTSIAYTISAVVSDLIHTTSTVRTVSAEACSFNIKNNGDGLGIGKYSTHSGAIDLSYDIYTDGNIINKNYQNVVGAGTNATIDNAGKGISTYFVAYCGLDASDEVVSGTEGAGMLVMFEGQEIMKEGFTGLTTSISGTIFSFGWASGNNKLKYRVFENNLGSYT